MDTHCSTEGCAKPTVARGLCSSHYYGAKRAGTLDEVAPKRLGACENCGVQISASRRFGSRFCSLVCKEQARERARTAEVMARRAGRVCVRCGGPIPLTASTKSITCSKTCSVIWQNEKRRADQLAAWNARKQPCPRCGNEVPDSRWGAIYCSPECKKLTMDARWRERAPGYMRQYLYGITPEQFAERLEAQGGRCAICRTDTPGGKGGWHVDHDHTTGTVRGLLCHRCNLMLGNAADNPDRLRAAAEYLSMR